MVGEGSAPPSREKRLAFSALMVSGTVAISFTILEGGLRAAAYWRSRQPRAEPVPLSLLQPNPHGSGSYRLKPNLDITTKVGNETIRIRTNAHGMHWRDVTIAKPPGIKRVAFLGDSFTFGCWAADFDRTFVGVFDSRLRSRGVEALNFGVGGYGLLHEELLLREEVQRFSPDFVVVVLFAGNDIRDTFLGLRSQRLVEGTAELDQAVIRERVPAEWLVKDTTRAAECPPASSLDAGVRRLAVFRALDSLVALQRPCVEFRVNRSFTAYSFWSQKPYPAVAEAAKDEFLAALERIGALCRSMDARLLIAALPTRDQVYARHWTGPDYDIAFPQGYVQTFARERGIPFLDLLPPLREHVAATRERPYWPDDIHLNDRGHELIGNWLARWFRLLVLRRGAADRG